MTTKKLLARQARQAEYLSRFYFKLMYQAGKSNIQADVLSYKAEDIKEQQKVIKQHHMQIILLRSKIDQAIVKDLKIDSQAQETIEQLVLIALEDK